MSVEVSQVDAAGTSRPYSGHSDCTGATLLDCELRWFVYFFMIFYCSTRNLSNFWLIVGIIWYQ